VAAGTGGLGYENARLRSPPPTGRCRGREAPRSRRCRALAGARRPAQAGDDRSGVPRHAADSGKVQLDQNGAFRGPIAIDATQLANGLHKLVVVS
jgi:hypothetical protein